MIRLSIRARHDLAHNGVRVKLTGVLIGVTNHHGLPAVDYAGHRIFASRNDVEQRRFARAVRADNGQARTRLDQQVDVRENGVITEPLGDTGEFNHLIAEASRSGTKFEIVATYPSGSRAAGDDLVSAPQPRLWLGRAGRSAAPQPSEFFASKDFARRFLRCLAVDPLGTGIEVRRVSAGASRSLVDVRTSVIKFDDATRANGAGQSVEGVPVVRDEHKCRLHRDETRLEPFDGFKVEVVRRLVEHDHVKCALLVVSQHLGQSNTLGLTTGKLVGPPVEERQHTERSGRCLDFPAVAEHVTHDAFRQLGILFE